MKDLRKNSLFIKLILTILTIAMVIGVGVLFTYLAKSTTDGNVIIKVETLENEIVSQKSIRFNEGDKLIDLIIKEYGDSFVYEDSEYGAMIKAIAGIEETSTDSYLIYIAIYVNDEYANYGISYLPYKDGDIITFKLERYDYN